MGDLIDLFGHRTEDTAESPPAPSEVQKLTKALHDTAPGVPRIEVTEELLARISRQAAEHALESQAQQVRSRRSVRRRRTKRYNPPPPDRSAITDELQRLERETAHRKGML